MDLNDADRSGEFYTEGAGNADEDVERLDDADNDETPLPEETQRSDTGEDLAGHHSNINLTEEPTDSYLNYLSTLLDCNSNLSLIQIQVSHFIATNLNRHVCPGRLWLFKL